MVSGVVALAAPAWAETLPEQADKAQVPAKFFPINPAALVRPSGYRYTSPPVRPAVAEKPVKVTNGKTSISEEQARKLLEIYAN